jgi:hypothetical protein
MAKRMRTLSGGLFLEALVPSGVGQVGGVGEDGGAVVGAAPGAVFQEEEVIYGGRRLDGLGLGHPRLVPDLRQGGAVVEVDPAHAAGGDDHFGLLG